MNPKTGYNTIEKIANASSEGDSDEGGSDEGSGDAQIIYATVTTEDGETYTCDHDGMELIQAIKDGSLVVIVDHVEYYGSAIATYNEDDNSIYASILMHTNVGVQGCNIYFAEDLSGNYRWIID